MLQVSVFFICFLDGRYRSKAFLAIYQKLERTKFEHRSERTTQGTHNFNTKHFIGFVIASLMLKVQPFNIYLCLFTLEFVDSSAWAVKGGDKKLSLRPEIESYRNRYGIGEIKRAETKFISKNDCDRYNSYLTNILLLTGNLFCLAKSWYNTNPI